MPIIFIPMLQLALRLSLVLIYVVLELRHPVISNHFKILAKDCMKLFFRVKVNIEYRYDSLNSFFHVGYSLVILVKFYRWSSLF